MPPPPGPAGSRFYPVRTYYPAGGYVEGQGTRPSENGWDAEQFLRPIVESITG